MNDHEYTTTIYSWQDLEEYGINALTGEACAYGLRLLCDVNANGLALLEKFLSLPSGGLELNPNWNSTVHGAPAIGSVMLPPGIIADLGVFIMFHVHGYPFALVGHNGHIVGTRLRPTETHQSYLKAVRTNMNSSRSDSGRNVHQMTGREV